MLQPDTTWIGTAVFRGRKQPPPRSMYAASRRVESASYRPPDLAPSAILIIRWLRIAQNNAWQESLQQTLSERLAGAYRPAFAIPPASAEAVLFADEAEMLVCLARDVEAGMHGRYWWWRNVLRRLPAPITLEKLVLAHPRLIPSIVVSALLAGSLRTLLSALGVQGAFRAANAMFAEFLVDASLAAAVRFAGAVSVDSWPIICGAGPLPPGTTTVNWTDAPFNRWITLSEIEGVSLIPAVFAAISVGLVREQILLHSPRFADSAITWLQAQFAPAAPSPSLATPQFEEFVQSCIPVPAAPIQSQPAVPTPIPAVSPALGEAGATETSLPIGVRKPHARNPVPQIQATGSMIPVPSVDCIGATPPPAVSPCAASTASQTKPISGVTTAFGGIFFLIHVMQRLNVPDCFPQCHELSQWGWLELVARSLLSYLGPLAPDPIWSVLRELDGREKGPACEPLWADPFHLPEIWTASARVEGQESGVATAAPHIAEWLRIQLATETVEAAIEILLFLNARVDVTSVSVDVTASLDSARVGVRCAGFDIDPGWLPYFSRIIQFHYR